jgi:hypothetical protein
MVHKNETATGVPAGLDVVSESVEVDRTILPIPDQYDGELPFDARDPAAMSAPIEELRPPEGAPNVLVILLDDVGFGASSAFGGVGARRRPSSGSRARA